MTSLLNLPVAHMSGPNYLVAVERVYVCLDGNAYYPGPWPGWVPTLAQLGALFGDYKTAYYGVLEGDQRLIPQRDALRAQLNTMLGNIALYLESVAKGDLAMLASTGFELRRPRTHASPVRPDAPKNFELVHGADSGSVEASCSSQDDAVAFDVEMCQGDPLAETSWRHVLTSAHCRHLSINALIPGQAYWLRMRAIGSAGSGAWTEPLSIIAV